MNETPEQSATEKVIRWGMIGCGDVTEVKSGPGFQKANGSELVHVMRRNGDLARDYATRHEVPRWSDSAQTVIDDPQVDAIYIATPPSSHEELALQVARSRKPCYVEKPMARTHSECQRMIGAFEAAQTPLFVAFYRRAMPRFVLVKELLQQETLGEITSVTYRQRAPLPQNVEAWRLNPETAGGGLFVDVGSHTLDILDWLLGPLQNVRGSAARFGPNYRVEDVVSLSFQLQNGAACTGSWNFAASLREDMLTLDGSKGRLTGSIFGSEAWYLERKGNTEPLPVFNPPHVQQPLIQSIVDELRGVGKCPSTGISAARTAQVMDSALTDFYGGREDGFWNR